MRAQTPLAPVHLRARRGADGLHFSWVRRGRVDADGWDAADIPLDEASERYRIEILSGAATLRSAEVSEQTWLYEAGLELADFGQAQTQLEIRIRQLGRAVPLGIAAQAILQL